MYGDVTVGYGDGTVGDGDGTVGDGDDTVMIRSGELKKFYDLNNIVKIYNNINIYYHL